MCHSVKLTHYQKFSSLLDPNPRRIKRFLNTYSMARVVRVLEGNLVSGDTLALWTIIRVRWPALAKHLRSKPDDVQLVGVSPLPDDAEIPDRVESLFHSSEVSKVVTFGEGGPLTPRLVRDCCGISELETS